MRAHLGIPIDYFRTIERLVWIQRAPAGLPRVVFEVIELEEALLPTKLLLEETLRACGCFLLPKVAMLAQACTALRPQKPTAAERSASRGAVEKTRLLAVRASEPHLYVTQLPSHEAPICAPSHPHPPSSIHPSSSCLSSGAETRTARPRRLCAMPRPMPTAARESGN